MQTQKVKLNNSDTIMELEIEDDNHPCYWVKERSSADGKAWVNFSTHRPGVGGNSNVSMVARQYSKTRGSRKVVRINLDEMSALALYRFLELKYGSVK
jgi:hypothetical protein